MEQARWTERKFSFDFPVEWLLNIIERLYGTSARLRELTASLTEVIASVRLNGGWSIKEHIGHLFDLEELHLGRIEDFKEGNKILRAADMTNAKTYGADHNSKSLQQLLNDFAEERKKFIHQLMSLDKEVHLRKALHPRLQKQMRPADVAYFTAEHDDHHLATIRRLLENLKA